MKLRIISGTVRDGWVPHGFGSQPYYSQFSNILQAFNDETGKWEDVPRVFLGQCEDKEDLSKEPT